MSPAAEAAFKYHAELFQNGFLKDYFHDFNWKSGSVGMGCYSSQEAALNMGLRVQLVQEEPTLRDSMVEEWAGCRKEQEKLFLPKEGEGKWLLMEFLRVDK